MGLFSFAKTAGRKIGLFGGSAAEEAEEAKAAQATDDRREQRNRMIAMELKKAVEGYGLEIADLAVSFAAGTATLGGRAHTQADKEKAVLVVGNTEGVAQVDDQLEVEVVEPPAIFHTVVKGDTLSEIADANYGVMRLFPVIFDANRPMLEHPDQIYPGQVLRIPRVDAPVHTVAGGETLGTIAKHYYGQPKRYKEIFEANRNVLDNPDRIEVGQQLVIPASGPAVNV